MDVIRLRTMTMKSSYHGGPWAGVPIKTLIGRDQKYYCVVAYYKYDTINYTNDVLEALGITKEVQIPKPGSNIDMLKAWKKVNSLDDMTDQERMEFMSKLKSGFKRKAKSRLKRSEGVSRGYLAAKNMKRY